MNEFERERRAAASRSGGVPKSLYSRAAEHIAANRAMEEITERVTRQRVERDAAPLITRDAVLALNERMDAVLDSNRTLTLLTVAVLIVGVLALVVAVIALVG